jgi:hypothetical protein
MLANVLGCQISDWQLSGLQMSYVGNDPGCKNLVAKVRVANVRVANVLIPSKVYVGLKSV